MRTAKLLATVAIPALLAASTAWAAQPAQAFPEKPMRLIIGSASGSGPDIMARLIADHLYGVWGQRVVVDTRPGVAGIISAEIVKAARAPAFGERLKVLGIEIIGGGRKELSDFRTAERKRVAEIVKVSGISITK